MLYVLDDKLKKFFFLGHNFRPKSFLNKSLSEDQGEVNTNSSQELNKKSTTTTESEAGNSQTCEIVIGGQSQREEIHTKDKENLWNWLL